MVNWIDHSEYGGVLYCPETGEYRCKCGSFMQAKGSNYYCDMCGMEVTTCICEKTEPKSIVKRENASK